MPDDPSGHPSTPTRTCVGCRRRDRPDLMLRLVLRQLVDPGSGRVTLVVQPDPRRRLPGRGAWLHRDERCLREADRRRALVRALRASGPVDIHRLREHLAQTTDERAGDPS